MTDALHGKRILITREEGQANEFSHKVKEYGGEPVIVPLLQISCRDLPGNEKILQHAEKYNWIFFTSVNGVKCFFKLAEKYHATNSLNHIKFAVTGSKTAYALESFGYAADLIPAVYNAEELAKDFISLSEKKEPVLLVRGNKSRMVLPDTFRRVGIKFDCMEVYETRTNSVVHTRLNQVLDKTQIDFITFTSPSAVEAFYEMSSIPHKGPVIVCIGTTTEQRALELGMEEVITPEEFTIDGMIKEISDYIKKKG